MSAQIKSEPDLGEDVIASADHVMAIDDDDEDLEDEVVREIDVFLSPELSQQLHLMQFPLHQTSMASPTEVRMKPRHCM